MNQLGRRCRTRDPEPCMTVIDGLCTYLSICFRKDLFPNNLSDLEEKDLLNEKRGTFYHLGK
ncbi:hypothetical protein ACTXT7_016058 [Hymenolepis weldensis]